MLPFLGLHSLLALQHGYIKAKIYTLVNAPVHGESNGAYPISVAIAFESYDRLNESQLIFPYIDTVQIVYFVLLAFYCYKSESTNQISLKL